MKLFEENKTSERIAARHIGMDQNLRIYTDCLSVNWMNVNIYTMNTQILIFFTDSTISRGDIKSTLIKCWNERVKCLILQNNNSVAYLSMAEQQRAKFNHTA